MLAGEVFKARLNSIVEESPFLLIYSNMRTRVVFIKVNGESRLEEMFDGSIII